MFRMWLRKQMLCLTELNWTDWTDCQTSNQKQPCQKTSHYVHVNLEEEVKYVATSRGRGRWSIRKRRQRKWSTGCARCCWSLSSLDPESSQRKYISRQSNMWYMSKNIWSHRNTVKVVQTNLSKIRRIDPRSSPPSFLEPLRYVGDGDRYLMETQQ